MEKRSRRITPLGDDKMDEIVRVLPCDTVRATKRRKKNGSN